MGAIDVSDFIIVTDLRCWWQKSVTKISILSSHFVSNTRYQHRCNLERISDSLMNLNSTAKASPEFSTIKILKNRFRFKMCKDQFKLAIPEFARKLFYGRGSIGMVNFIETLEKLNLKNIFHKNWVSKSYLY